MTNFWWFGFGSAFCWSVLVSWGVSCCIKGRDRKSFPHTLRCNSYWANIQHVNLTAVYDHSIALWKMVVHVDTVHLVCGPLFTFFVLAGTVEQCSHWQCVLSQIYHLFSCCRNVSIWLISHHVCHERSARQTESPQHIPRNCCFTSLCIWLDDLLAENAW